MTIERVSEEGMLQLNQIAIGASYQLKGRSRIATSRSNKIRDVLVAKRQYSYEFS